jgi:hypothetical protein
MNHPKSARFTSATPEFPPLQRQLEFRCIDASRLRSNQVRTGSRSGRWIIFLQHQR